MHPAFEYLLDLLFPPRCVGCRERGACFCAGCMASCRPLPAVIDRALHRRLTSPSLTSISAAYLFEDTLRRAVHSLKYQRRARLAVPLGELLVRHVDRYRFAVDALVPVPLHPERERWRGFNQAALLARQVADYTGLPLMWAQLVRVRQTAQQVGLNRDQRLANVRDAFAWHGDTPSPPRILLLDDVVTTGATFTAAAHVLRRAGAREVHALALAHGY